jgi:hypothetical protein
VAIDLQLRGDSDYFKSWLTKRGQGRVTTHWGVRQDDPDKLQRILEDRLSPLDLVVDDASHMRKPTVRSFELPFPHVRPGGFYIIEDWAWALQPEFQSRQHGWSMYPSLHPVAHQIMKLHGSRPDLIEMRYVYPDALIVQRGPGDRHAIELDRADRSQEKAMGPHRRG